MVIVSSWITSFARVSVRSHRLVGFAVVERPTGQLAAGLQREDGVGAADIGDQVAALVDRGSRKPLAAFTLIGAQPIDAAPQSRVVRRDTEFPRDDDDKSGSIAVTGFGVERLAVWSGRVPSSR